MNCRPCNDTERTARLAAIRGIAQQGGAGHMDRREVSFLGISEGVTDTDYEHSEDV